ARCSGASLVAPAAWVDPGRSVRRMPTTAVIASRLTIDTSTTGGRRTCSLPGRVGRSGSRDASPRSSARSRVCSCSAPSPRDDKADVLGPPTAGRRATRHDSPVMCLAADTFPETTLMGWNAPGGTHDAFVPWVEAPGRGGGGRRGGDRLLLRQLAVRRCHH